MNGSEALRTPHAERHPAGLFRRGVTVLGEGFEHPPFRRLFLAVAGSLLFLFPFGLFFNVTGILVDANPWTSSVYILLITLATLASELRARPFLPVVREFLLLASVLWGVEWLGVATGFPFGEYRYTDVLGLLIGGVPLAIPCAWYATVMNSRRIAELLTERRAGGPIAVAVLAGMLTLALDIVLEPMAAMVKDYWLWAGDTVPVQNYVSWVLFTVLAVSLLRRPGRRSAGVQPGPSAAQRHGLSAAAVLLYGLQWLLFVVTGGAHGHLLPAMVSGVILALTIRSGYR